MYTLDPYAARSCPLKTHHAFTPGLARPQPAGTTARMPGSTAFLAAVYEQIVEGDASVADLRSLTDRSSEAQEAACLAAMDKGTDVILGGLLPRDWSNHRSGRADLLLRDPAGGYVPGLVKYQRVVDQRRDELPYSYSELTDLTSPQTALGWRYRWHWRWPNALQLAHLWCLLGPTGYRAAGAATAVIIGNDDIEGLGPRAVWLDLTEAAAPPPPQQVTEGGTPAQVSAMERYEYEFAVRVRIAEQAGDAVPGDPLPSHPIVSYECGYCPWWPTCRPHLDDDVLSLRINKSRLDSHEITVLREAGVATVGQLAAHDLETLLPAYLPRVGHRSGAEDRLRLAQRRSRLLVHGVELERTTTGTISVPAATLEIDVDVETSREDRVYLWGFWVNDGDGGGSYREFSRFTDLDENQERALAREAMAWLRDQVAGTESLVYHYSDYEVVRLTRLAEPSDDVFAWALDYARDRFVDLFPIVRQHYFGTNGLGLKVVASAGVGFHWRDEDPGGLNSMRWFEDAVHGLTAEDRENARTRVLQYNEDDVLATCQLRRWLREQV